MYIYTYMPPHESQLIAHGPPAALFVLTQQESATQFFSLKTPLPPVGVAQRSFSEPSSDPSESTAVAFSARVQLCFRDAVFLATARAGVGVC